MTYCYPLTRLHNVYHMCAKRVSCKKDNNGLRKTRVNFIWRNTGILAGNYKLKVKGLKVTFLALMTTFLVDIPKGYSLEFLHKFEFETTLRVTRENGKLGQFDVTCKTLRDDLRVPRNRQTVTVSATATATWCDCGCSEVVVGEKDGRHCHVLSWP